MNAFQRLALSGTVIVSFAFSSNAAAEIDFFCDYGPRPITYGANPTLWSQYDMTQPESTIPRTSLIRSNAESCSPWGPVL